MATTIREDGARLLVLAARVTARLKRPPTLDPEDMIQDAVVALIETLDQLPHRPLPPTYPFDLALILRARQRLGGKAAYRDEWRWSNRRWHDGTDMDQHPERAAAPLSATDDTIVDSVLDLLPDRLHTAARLLLTPSDTPVKQRWVGSGLTRRLYETQSRQVMTRLRDAGVLP